jgi:hypothetical protein
MRRAVAFSLVSVGALLLCGSETWACGDKFLVVGRGVRYQRVHPAMRPASILIYMNPSSHVPAAAKEIQLESGLKQAGHKVETVADSASLDGALKSAKYDLVLADIADSAALEKKAETGKTVVVPVLFHPTADELAAAQKQYGCAMKATSQDYLSAIDEALKSKGTEAKPAAGK